MPYINKDDRLQFKPIIDKFKDLCDRDYIGYGEINYLITTLLKEYLIKSSFDQEILHYHLIQNLIGLLECTKLELYRRIAGPYEDKKCKENGDVYDL